MDRQRLGFEFGSELRVAIFQSDLNGCRSLAQLSGSFKLHWFYQSLLQSLVLP
jgi:hypothetical protein